MDDNLKVPKETQFSKNNAKMNLIPKSNSKNNINTKIIKNKRANNYFNIYNKNINCNSKTISNQEYKSSLKKNSNYITINKSLLLSAYENSLLILFNTLKLYMKNDVQFFNKIKDNFIKNVQNYYQENKKKLSIIIPNNKNISKKNHTKSNSKIAVHKANNSYMNHPSNKFSSHLLANNSINKSNNSIQTSVTNLKKRNNELCDKKINTVIHKKSLCSLKKATKPLMSSNQIKNLIKKDYNLSSILKNYFENNKKTRNINSSNNKKSFNKNNKLEENEKNEEIKNKEIICNKNIIENCNFNINNNIINNIDNNEKKEIKNEKNKDLITSIKNSLDENLKKFFDFSYESFLNKETEREGY